MSLKCHFDADGWLQGPIKITHLTSPNHFPSGFAARARGMVQHTEDGFEAGTVATFMNPAAKVSAFFSVDELGNAHQYLPVGRGLVAWAEAGGNPAWYSCEFEDKLNPGSPMTQPQMVAGAQILEACSARDGFPLQLTNDTVNGRGLITHGAGGAAWGNHPSCPGPVRKAQGAHVVALAMSIRQGSPVTGDWTDAMIANLPTLTQGTADKAGAVQMVHRMQALAKVIGDINKIPAASAVAPTGIYDRTTSLGVLALQKFFALTQDGAVGPKTWAALVAGDRG